MEIPKFDNLYMRDLRGNIREWKIHVEFQEADNTAFIVTNAGILDKRYTESRRHIRTGKNIGRANETSALEQAFSEAQSMWQKKLDAGMLRDKAAVQTHEPVFPMLAHRFDEHSKKINYPAYMQPKLDGCRALATIDPETNAIRIISRKNKDFNFLDHIRAAIKLLNLPVGLYLDGELFTKELPFEEIVGLCRKDKRISNEEKEKMLKIEYHIYDCFDVNNKDRGFKNRHEIVCKYLNHVDKSSPLKKVYTQIVRNADETQAWYDIFYKQQKYEGAMIRNSHARYAINKRSYDLQKIKEFQDAEFEIIGFKEATGNDTGTIVWLCKTRNGDEFDVRPKATREARAQLFESAQKDFEQFYGKQLTVQFQGFTNGDVPRFPVGVGIRDYE